MGQSYNSATIGEAVCFKVLLLEADYYAAHALGWKSWEMTWVTSESLGVAAVGLSYSCPCCHGGQHGSDF